MSDVDALWEWLEFSGSGRESETAKLREALSEARRLTLLEAAEVARGECSTRSSPCPTKPGPYDPVCAMCWFAARLTAMAEDCGNGCQTHDRPGDAMAEGGSDAD